MLHQPHTHETLSYDSCSLNYKVVPAVRLGCSNPISWKVLLRFFSFYYSVVQEVLLGWTTLNSWIFFSDPGSLNYSVVCAFRLDWSPPNSWNILLQSLSLHLIGSSRSSAGSTNSNSRNILLWSLFSQLVFKAVQQGRTIHQTHGMLSCNPCSQNYSAVRAVRLNGTTLNSWNIVLWSFFPQLLASSSSSGWVQVPWTHEIFSILWSLFSPLLGSSSSSVRLNYVPRSHKIFSYDPYSLNYLLVQAVGWFKPTRIHKKLSYYPSSLNYWAVRAGLLGWYNPNSWIIILRPLFTQWHGSSSSSTRFKSPKHLKHYLMILLPWITR